MVMVEWQKDAKDVDANYHLMEKKMLLEGNTYNSDWFTYINNFNYKSLCKFI